MTITIPKKSLRRVMQVAKDNHSQNIELSVTKSKARFTCDNGEIIEIEGVK